MAWPEICDADAERAVAHRFRLRAAKLCNRGQPFGGICLKWTYATAYIVYKVADSRDIWMIVPKYGVYDHSGASQLGEQ
jgi:hypothetical protein